VSNLHTYSSENEYVFFLYMVLAHSNNTIYVEMSFHSDKLSGLRAIQSLPLFPNTACFGKKQRIPTTYSLWFVSATDCVANTSCWPWLHREWSFSGEACSSNHSYTKCTFRALLRVVRLLHPCFVFLLMDPAYGKCNSILHVAAERHRSLHASFFVRGREYCSTSG
jgi:hypothetical protein